jgi:hypothetical protein
MSMLRVVMWGIALFGVSFALLACSGDDSKPQFETRGVSAPTGFCAADPRSVAEAEKISDIDEGNGCGVRNAWSATALGGVALDKPNVFNCATVYTASKWMMDVVQPAAQENFGSRVVKIDVPSAYACRSRNSVRGAKLSEHGFGNAIDVSRFTLEDGRRIDVLTGWYGDQDSRQFLRTVRGEACGRFFTVLGPGSDYHHRDHIHMDLQRQRGGGPYCH